MYDYRKKEYCDAEHYKWAVNIPMDLSKAASFVAKLNPYFLSGRTELHQSYRPIGHNNYVKITDTLRSHGIKTEGEKTLAEWANIFKANGIRVPKEILKAAEEYEVAIQSSAPRQDDGAATLRSKCELPDYLDSHHARYAPKLAATVRAWEAVTEPGKLSPKRALKKWLTEHASEYEPLNEKNKPINTAIEECAKVANWQPRGGAPTTQGR